MFAAADKRLALSGLNRTVLRRWLVSTLSRQIGRWIDEPPNDRLSLEAFSEVAIRPQMERIADTTETPELDPAVRACARTVMASSEVAASDAERTLQWLMRRLSAAADEALATSRQGDLVDAI